MIYHSKELGKDFNSKEELFKELLDNKETIIAQKKAEKKNADGFGVSSNLIVTNKAKSDNEDLTVKIIINTTNFLDSHGDVHIKDLWKKTLQENKNIMHLQEHQMAFDKIISSGQDVKAYTQDYTWKELGYDFDGSTQALVFDSTVKEARNKYMYDQYLKGYVTNHSVGMQYVKLELAVNSTDYPEENEIWNKYYPIIANKEVADEQGYFWVVKEAKVIEGSAVPIGSNTATPTLEVKEPLNALGQPQKCTINDFKETLNKQFLLIKQKRK